MRKLLIGSCWALGLSLGLASAAGPAWAITATVDGTPPVTVTVPSGFQASDSNHGVEIKTPDEEVMVWCETYMPADEKTMQKEHAAYWKDQGVKLGEPVEHKSEDGVKVAVESFADATYEGKPTIVQYMFIDANLPEKEQIVMTVWASPEAYLAHKDDIKAMMTSVAIK